MLSGFDELKKTIHNKIVKKDHLSYQLSLVSCDTYYFEMLDATAERCSMIKKYNS